MSSDQEESIPDIGSMSDQELKDLIKIKREAGDTALSGADVEQLTDILLGKVPTAPAEEDEAS